MEYNIKISKEKYNLAALKVINCFLNLTDYELDIIVKMLDNNINILNRESRSKIRKLTNKSYNTTNNYIKRLKDKKILLYINNELVLNKNITNHILDKEIKIKFDVN